MKVMMTGAPGLLEYALREECRSRGDETYGLYKESQMALSLKGAHSDFEAAVLGDSRLDDSPEFERLVMWCERVRPDVLVHAAAWTDVDGCELDRVQAVRWNALSCRDVAGAASRFEIPLVVMSTDYVFSGESTSPYKETDDPAPISIYGLTKWLGEEIARSATNSRLLIVRTSWLFGPNGRNFVDAITTKLLAGEQLSIVNDQRGCPTYTKDLARGIRDLVLAQASGTFHVAGSGDCTWFEFAIEIARFLGLESQVKPTTTSGLGRPAPRPGYSVLDCSKFSRKVGWNMPIWQDAMRRHLFEATK